MQFTSTNPEAREKAISARNLAAYRAMQQACVELNFPNCELALVSRARRDICLIGNRFVMHYAPREVPEAGQHGAWLDAKALRREGQLINGVSNHFRNTRWKVPEILKQAETFNGLVQLRTQVSGAPLGILGYQQFERDPSRGEALCREVGLMLAHLHNMPTESVATFGSNDDRRMSATPDDLPRFHAWLERGKLPAGEAVDADLRRRAICVLKRGAHYLAAKVTPVPIHGDLHGGNLLLNGKELGLIDFEHTRLADPHADFAFLGPFSPAHKRRIAATYTEACGREIDFERVAFFNLIGELRRVVDGHERGMKSGFSSPGRVNSGLADVLKDTPVPPETAPVRLAARFTRAPC